MSQLETVMGSIVVRMFLFVKCGVGGEYPHPSPLPERERGLEGIAEVESCPYDAGGTVAASSDSARSNSGYRACISTPVNVRAKPAVGDNQVTDIPSLERG